LPDAPDLEPLVRTAGPTWTAADAESTYSVPLWGGPYFYVNEKGNAAARPDPRSDLSIDLHAVTERLSNEGVRFPALIRLQDLLQSRVRELNESFQRAIESAGYRNRYQGVYPIKVNQLREVVEEILDAGLPYDFGIECGSRSELVAALPFLEQYDTILLCNGCKDQRMMDLMVSAQVLGRRVFPIVERFEEVHMLRRAVSGRNVSSGEDTVGAFGARVRLSASGAGLWSESGGANSKFGISLTELLRLVEILRKDGTLDRFQLLHFHLGSQIADVANVESAVREAGRIYAWLRKQGVDVRYLDIGGGLGVNYEAGNELAIGHINYDLDEYTSAVVNALAAVCNEAGVEHPIIISESGRAITAHHSVLIVEAIGQRSKDRVQPDEDAPEHDLVKRLVELYAESHSATEDASDVYASALDLREKIIRAFRGGDLSLEDKAQAERLFWSLSRRSCVAATTKNGENSELMSALEPQLVDHYLCDFSVFRSMVDYWAIGQRFPIMPIHRLQERPTRRGMLDDLTCDSDGRVSDFVSPTGDKHYLELHPINPGEPYYLGFFLMGAYQDIMGDMHNLFGRVTEAHVYLDDEEPGGFYIEKIIDGASVREQLELVQYHANDLERRMHALIQRKVRAGKIRPYQGVQLLEQYRQSFAEYTYLDGTPTDSFLGEDE
jgi:arginine decarboxylase